MGWEKPTTLEDKEWKFKVCDVYEKHEKGEGQQQWFNRATALIYWITMHHTLVFTNGVSEELLQAIQNLWDWTNPPLLRTRRVN
jgi:hypothetical protein